MSPWFLHFCVAPDERDSFPFSHRREKKLSITGKIPNDKFREKFSRRIFQELPAFSQVPNGQSIQNSNSVLAMCGCTYPGRYNYKGELEG